MSDSQNAARTAFGALEDSVKNKVYRVADKAVVIHEIRTDRFSPENPISVFCLHSGNYVSYSLDWLKHFSEIPIRELNSTEAERLAYYELEVLHEIHSLRAS